MALIMGGLLLQRAFTRPGKSMSAAARSDTRLPE
jgi:hypothetical protein